VVHRVATLDAQPSNPEGGIVVLVTGQLLVCLIILPLCIRSFHYLIYHQVDEEQKPMSYTQVFQLLPAAGSYYVFNDVFRLVYAGA
jgi:hypothetical protein